MKKLIRLSVASGQVLHCSTMSHKKDARLKWVYIQPQRDISVHHLIISFGVPWMGDLRLTRSVIRKSRFIFMKEWRTIRQKSGCLDHLNQQIFQVNIQMQGWINDSWNRVLSIKVLGFTLLI